MIVDREPIRSGPEHAPGADVDVLVIGSGIAGLTAAVTAAEAGRRVVLVDAADQDDRGGNTSYSVGIARVAVADRNAFVALLDRDTVLEDFVPPYPVQQYVADLRRATRGEGDDRLHQVVAEGSNALAHWLSARGVRWTVPPMRFGRDPHDPTHPVGLPPGAGLVVRGGGAALVDVLLDRANRLGVDVRFTHTVQTVQLGDHPGVRLTDGTVLTAGAVVLAAGSFEASAPARARYLGPGWERARIRGTRHNTGQVLEAALAAGAAAAGQWHGAHAVAFDPSAPVVGQRDVGDVHGRYSYPYGITVNTRGDRFFDEGADEKNFTYATIGRAIAAQPGRVAFQVFDDAARELLEPRYATREPVEADSIPELAEQLGLPIDRFVDTVRAFNSGCSGGHLDPASLDHLTSAPPGQPTKSNWAVPIAKPPFRAYQVEPSITFAFGGLSIDDQARVLDPTGHPLPGLYAAGGIVGGVAVHNLPAGTGMVAAGVLGRIAGTGAVAATASRTAVIALEEHR